MAKFTATVPLNVRLPAPYFEVSGAAGATHRIPDALVEEFIRDIVPAIPGGVTWVTQDETSAIAGFDPSTKYDKTGGTISGAVTVTGALVGQSTLSMVGAATLGSVIAAAVTATTAAFRGKPHYDVMAFGAAGDGVTDDLTAIQNAINTATAAGGGIVFLPRGTYNVSAPIVLKSNVWVRGSGQGVTIIQPHLSAGHTHHLFVNQRGQTTSGSADSYLRLSDMTLDGRSTGSTDDNRLGYGVEIYGAAKVWIHDLDIRNMPLSGIEISGDKAAILNGKVSIAGMTDIFVQRIRLSHVGWQEQFLSASERSDTWGDAGFGILVRATASKVLISDVIATDIEFNGVGVGQLSNLQESAREVLIVNCEVDQSGVTTPLAPSFRASFCEDVTFSNCIAKGNTGSQGFASRQAGTTPVRRVAFIGCSSLSSDYGFIVSNADSTIENAHITFSGCVAKGNTNDGFDFDTSRNVTVSACQSISNGRDGFQIVDTQGFAIGASISSANTRHGFNVRASVGTCTRGNLTGNQIMSNGSSAATDCGVQLTSCSKILVIGNVIQDTGTTQDHGVRETGSADSNLVAYNFLTGLGTPATKLGASSVFRDNAGYVTENSGTGTIGAAVTTASITHGLSATPAAADIWLTQTNNSTTDAGSLYITGITSSVFIVNCRTAPGASTLTFSWQARIK